MHHSYRIYLLFTIITISSTLPPSQAAETGSSHNIFILDQLTDKSFFVGRANLVTRDGLSDTFFAYVDGSYRYSLEGPWSVELGYRHALLKMGDNIREEYRPMLALYWRGKLANGKFSNRSRMEWRFFEGNSKNRRRYRNESVWTALNTITDLQLIPFVEEEIFYDFTDNELNMNWLTFGISKFWGKGMKWKVGYRLQSQKFNGKWESRHVLVTGISILSFK